MKTKIMTKLSSLILLLFLCVILVSGCTGTWDGPETGADVTGNGGLAVQKGQYLYFVNGYTARDDMKDGDNKGELNYSGIYRAKLDENNNLMYEEDGTLKDCKKIVSKVAGYDDASLYIFGDYLYFSSPYADKVADEENSSQTNNFNLTDFYSIKLDGTSLSKLYTTENDSDDLQFSFVKTNNCNDVNLVVYDGSKIVVVNCTTKKSAIVSENVTGVAIPKVSEYKQNNNQISVQESSIYYTRSAKDDENISGNVLAYSLIGENTENVILLGQNTYTIKSANKDALVVSYKATDDIAECNRFITFDNNGLPQTDLNQINEQQLDSSGIASPMLCSFEDGNPYGIISTNANGKLVLLDYTNQNKPFVLNDDLSLTPLCIVGNYVYSYDSENSLYRTNYKLALTSADKSTCTETIYDSTKTVEEDSDDTVADIYFKAENNFSVLGNHIYFYIPYEGNSATGYYLNRINLLDSEKTLQLVGVVQQDHIKTEENTEE